MFFARIGTALFLVSALSLAKTPSDTSTICDRYKQSDLIFTGSAESPWIAVFDTGKSPIHRRREKSKRIRFLVREWFKGQRQDVVEIWMTPSDCPLQIEANEMYLIYARNNKDNGRTESNACMGTTPAAKASADLTYLNAALRGPGLATQISGAAGSEGVNIQAKSGIDIRYAIADSSGRFTFDGLAPADWSLSVNGSSPISVRLMPDSCVSADLPH